MKLSARSLMLRFAMLAALATPFSALPFVSPPLLAQQNDATIQATEKLFERATVPSRGATILTHLRSMRDPDLLPLFDHLSKSTDTELQIYSMVSATLLSKDPKRLDTEKLLRATEPSLVGSALASLIDNNAISDQQLLDLAANSAADPAQRAMCATELDHRGKLTDRTILRTLATNMKDNVRYYAATTLLQSKDPAEVALGLSNLNDMAPKHDLRAMPVQGLMMLRIRKDKITTAAPWLETLVKDAKNDDGLRKTAVAALLVINPDKGRELLTPMMTEETQTIEQVKLGLIAIEFATSLKPSLVAPLETSKSTLVRSIASIARQAAEGTDYMPDLEKLLAEGHPIVLNWALTYSERAPAPIKLRLRAAIIKQAAILDDIRSEDFHRAASAAEKLAEDNTPESLALLTSFLKADNKAAHEAVLLGLLRSDMPKPAELVLPHWERFSAKTAGVNVTNFAAVILAREGHKEAQARLAEMVNTARAENEGYRAIAGWYYAKLTNQSESMLKRVLANASTQPTTTPAK